TEANKVKVDNFLNYRSRSQTFCKGSVPVGVGKALLVGAARFLTRCAKQFDLDELFKTRINGKRRSKKLFGQGETDVTLPNSHQVGSDIFRNFQGTRVRTQRRTVITVQVFAGLTHHLQNFLAKTRQPTIRAHAFDVGSVLREFVRKRTAGMAIIGRATKGYTVRGSSVSRLNYKRAITAHSNINTTLVPSARYNTEIVRAKGAHTLSIRNNFLRNRRSRAAMLHLIVHQIFNAFTLRSFIHIGQALGFTHQGTQKPGIKVHVSSNLCHVNHQRVENTLGGAFVLEE